MADSLEQMFNEQPGFFSKLTDPFTLNKLVTEEARQRHGIGEDVGGTGDAYRHLLASAILAKRHGPGYAETIGNMHEWRVPFIGAGFNPAPEDTAMDLHNNSLGRQIAQESKSYKDVQRKVQANIDSGTAKTVYSRAQAPKQEYDPIDAAINKPIDLIRSMFSRK